jgi:hypothetical protein
MTADDLRPLRLDAGDTRIDLLAVPALVDADAEQVFDCLLGRQPRGHVLDGDRSVVFPARSPTGLGGLKIKGAGYRGGRVRLDRRHDKPYPLPRYDAEGAATLDAAKDHGRAYAGGMSYQQARQEFIVSRHLHRLGVQVFSGLAYGALRRDGVASWFCVLDWPAHGVHDWFTLMRERRAVERVAAAFGDTQRELSRHHVYLVLSGLVEFGGVLLRKDFHTAHIAGFDDSFLTRLSYYLFDTNFVLAQLVHDHRVPDIADHRTLARLAYVRALTDREFDPSRVDAFKRLLVELKYADWEMQQRIDRLGDDPIGRVLLEGFLADSGEQALFPSLPPLCETSEPAVAPPGERAVAPPGLFARLRRWR